MARTINFEGRRITVPDDATDDEVRSILESSPATPTPSAASSSPPSAQSIGTAQDMAESFASGVPRGVVNTAFLPMTATQLAGAGASRLLGFGRNVGRVMMGKPWLSQADMDAEMNNAIMSGRFAPPIDTTFIPDPDGAMGLANLTPPGTNFGALRDKVNEGLDTVLHKPQTTAGRYAETLGEFLAPGGIPSRATRAASTTGGKVGNYARDVIENVAVPAVPAVASETAGELTKGTSLEPWARVAGAVGGNVASAYGRGLDTVESIVRRRAPEPGSPIYDEARRLQDVGDRTGITLTGPELLGQAGAPAMPDLMRIVESSSEGRKQL